MNRLLIGQPNYGEPNVIIFDENPMWPTTIEQKLTFEDLSQYKQQMFVVSDQDYSYVIRFTSNFILVQDSLDLLQSDLRFGVQ